MGTFSLDSLIRPELNELSAYVPHPGDFEVRLDANEAPDFWSKQARERLGQATNEVLLSRYPDATTVRLRESLARRLGARAEELVLGTGSDEIIALLLSALSRPRANSRNPIIVTLTPTFVMYRMSARARGFQVIEVPLDESWQLDVKAVRRAVEALEPSMVFIATPNNPTGNLMNQTAIKEIVEAAPQSLVLIDEAYGAYARVSHADWLTRYPNVALLGTLSKIGLAALRVGWLRGSTALVDAIDKIRQPYNLPTLSQHLASVALNELGEEIDRAVNEVISERERVSTELTGLGMVVTPSAANFVWVQTQQPAVEVFEQLKSKSILVRSFHQRGGRLARQLRITIGTREENDRLLEALRT
ncbi:MAG: histidinol-phosphate transaminase [Polyangiaceae bacterium]